MTASSHSSSYLKFAALLTTLKWKSVALTVLAQYLAVLFAFHTREEVWLSLGEIKIHVIIWCTALFLAAGNIINNFYDAERDLINRPVKARFQHLVSRAFSLRLYFLLNTIGTLLAFYASWRIGVFFVVYGLALWFYSHKLSKMMFVREFTASLLAVTAFFSLLIYYQWITAEFLIYGFSLFLILFSREVYKDIRSVKGDVIMGYRSIATTIGITPSIRLFQILLLTSILPNALLIYQMDKWPMDVIIMVVSALVLGSVLSIAPEVVKKKRWVHRMIQLIIAIYICGIIWL